MRKKVIYTLLCVSFCAFLNQSTDAQKLDISFWIGYLSINSSAQCVELTSDNNLMISGMVNGGFPYIARINKKQEIESLKIFKHFTTNSECHTPQNYSAVFNDIIRLSDNNFLLIGYATANGNTDIIALKVSPDCVVLGGKIYYWGDNDEMAWTAIEDDDQSITVVGTSTSTSPTSPTNVYVLKLNSDLSKRRENEYKINNNSFNFGTGIIKVNSNYLIAGNCYGPEQSEVFLFYIDPANGQYISTFGPGILIQGKDINLQKIISKNSNELFLVGSIFKNFNDISLISVYQSPNLSLHNQYALGANSEDEGTSIVKVPNENKFYISGNSSIKNNYANLNSLIMETDDAGNSLGVNTYGYKCSTDNMFCTRSWAYDITYQADEEKVWAAGTNINNAFVIGAGSFAPEDKCSQYTVNFTDQGSSASKFNITSIDMSNVNHSCQTSFSCVEIYYMDLIDDMCIIPVGIGTDEENPEGCNCERLRQKYQK